MSDTQSLTTASPRIHQAIIDVMRDVNPIAKSQKNAQQGFNYRGIDQIYNAVHPLFSQHGVYSTSTILDAKHIDGKSANGKAFVHAILWMRFTFWAGDGSSVATEVVGEGIDYGGDKASNKAMSIADKYAILQLLKIPTAMVDAGGSTLPADESPNGNGKPSEPKKSVEELMKEAAAQAEKDSGDATATEFVSQQNCNLIQNLFTELGMTGDQQTAALTKRKASSIRNLTVAVGAELIATLQAKLAAIRDAKLPQLDPASSPDGATCGPCTPVQEQAIKSKFQEWKQIDPAAADAALAGFKKKLFDSGRQKIADLSASDATRLAHAIDTRKLDSFFQRSLEQWKPKDDGEAGGGSEEAGRAENPPLKSAAAA